MGQIDLTPTPAGYIRMLHFIVQNSTNAQDVAWAIEELAKMAGA